MNGFTSVRTLRVPIALLLALVPLPCLAGQATPSDSLSRARIIDAATDVMRAARYTTLITIGEESHPQARIVDPFAPETDLTIWIATNPLTRKVQDIRRDPRVTLLYFNTGALEYVTVLGRAELVTEASEKARRWKPEWKTFYTDENRGPDYLLIRVRPIRLEVVSARHGLTNDPTTWRPVVLDIP